MAEPQFYQWAAHISCKGKNGMNCDVCNAEVTLPIAPSQDIEPNDITRAQWIKRIRAIGKFVTKHKRCYSSSSTSL